MEMETAPEGAVRSGGPHQAALSHITMRELVASLKLMPKPIYVHEGALFPRRLASYTCFQRSPRRMREMVI